MDEDTFIRKTKQQLNSFVNGMSTEPYEKIAIRAALYGQVVKFLNSDKLKGIIILQILITKN